MPGRFRNQTGSKPRGVAGRNAGISWVLNNHSQGVVYFADDDNSYDIRLFNEVYLIKSFSYYERFWMIVLE